MNCFGFTGCSYVTKLNAHPIPTSTKYYVGGEASNLDESCDRATEQADRDLIGKFDVHVEDFTTGKKSMLDRCTHLYRLNRIELEAVEKGMPSDMPSEVKYLNACPSVRHITLDYMSVLPIVVKHTQALLTLVETICFDGCSHTSWLTITYPHSANGIACIFGNACATLVEAKQIASDDTGEMNFTSFI